MYYGGGAGGGKTDLAIGLAVTKHKRSLILRREFTQLKGIIDRSRQIIGQRGRFNENSGLWRGLPGDRLIELGGCQHLNDREKYQGRPKDLLVFDEAPQFLEDQVVFISAWARSEDPTQHVFVLLCGNPPTTPEGQWIVRRYAPWLDPEHPNPSAPYEVRWFAVIDGVDQEVASGNPFEHNGEIITPKSRTFVPALVDDNPVYMEAGYKTQLQNLPEPLRSQLLYGDHEAGQEDDPWQVIPTAWVQSAQERWKTFDISERQSLTALGVDVARGGKDKTVIARRYGQWMDKLVCYPGTTTPDGPAVAAQVVLEAQPGVMINVDVIGVGSSVYDCLAAAQAYYVRGVCNSEGSTAMDKSGQLHMANKRAEQWWHMRELLDPANGYDICLPPDTELTADLCAPRWKMTVRGVMIEEKDAVKDRIGRSPDKGDAVVMAFADCNDYALEIVTGSRKREAWNL